MTLTDPDPASMSRRAQIYVTASALRHFLIGLSLLAGPWLYSAAAFIPIFNQLPQLGWAWVMLLTGVLGLLGSFTRRAMIARLAIGASAVVTTVLAAGITIGLVNVWVDFYQVIGPDRFWALVEARPAIFPAELAVFVLAPPSPFLALILLSVSVKDFTMCAQPLRVPIEDPGIRRPRVA